MVRRRSLPERAARNRARAAAGCGLGAAAWALLVPVVGGCAASPYSHVSQYISELGASGAAHAAVVAATGFAPTGVLSLAFLAFASSVLPPSRRKTMFVGCFSFVGIAYLVSAVFRCDPGCPSSGSLSQAVHNTFGLFEYTGATAGLVLLGTALRRAPTWRALSGACMLSAVLVACGFVGMLIPALEPVRGVSQRVAEASIFTWVAYASVFLLRRPWNVASPRMGFHFIRPPR